MRTLAVSMLTATVACSVACGGDDATAPTTSSSTTTGGGHAAGGRAGAGGTGGAPQTELASGELSLPAANAFGDPGFHEPFRQIVPLTANAAPAQTERSSFASGTPPAQTKRATPTTPPRAARPSIGPMPRADPTFPLAESSTTASDSCSRAARATST